MKFILAASLLVAAVAAQDESCNANHIVEDCLSSQNAKMAACGPADYDCQCAAAEAIATCYNNCPNDPRKGSAEGEVQIYCGQASIFGDRAKAKATATQATGADGADSTPEPTSTSTEDEDEASSTDDADASESSPGGAATLAMNAGAMLAAVAGLMAVV